MKSKIMYGVYRSPKHAYPDSIQEWYKDAKEIVWRWKEIDYSWAKQAYVKRLHLTFLPEAVVDVKEHQYKIIKT